MLTTTVLENRIQVNYIHISQKEPEKVYIKTASHEDVGIVAPLKETALELDQQLNMKDKTGYLSLK